MDGHRRRASATTTLAASLLTASLTGCGDPVSGRIGVGLDDNQQPVILLLSCGSPLDVVTAFSTPTDGQDPTAAAELGRWVLTPPKDGLTVLDPSDPQAGWEGPSVPWPTDRRVNIDSGQTAGSVVGMSVVVEAGALAELDPEQVLVSDAGETLSRTAFEAACE